MAATNRNAVWLRQMRFDPGRLWRKSIVYGLNGNRALFVIALSVGAYEHAI
jgi:hypothetical protein